LGKPARTTFAKGLRSSPAANNLTGGIGHFPARSRDCQEQEEFPPSDEGVPQAVDFFGPVVRLIEDVSRSRSHAGTRRVVLPR
jgi:hypothetical protein